MITAINNANVLIDGKFQQMNVEITNNKITKITKIQLKDGIDAKGLTMLPAFFDMHVHFREPGQEHKEDLESGSRSAVKGGFGAVCTMPNTKPVIDEPALVKYLVQRAKEINLCKIYPIACITKGQQGKELAETGLLKQAGAIAISDDGVPVASGKIMLHALQYASGFDMPVISHSEDKELSNGGQINEGYISTTTGLAGIPKSAEEIAIARDILLTMNDQKLKLHFAHVSTKRSVDIIRFAKKNGANISCETCPHYLIGTDELCKDFNTNAKVNPPLRNEEDIDALIAGIKDGTIDAIATDHAPHSEAEKNVEFVYAPFGISGLETAFAICYTTLVKSGKINLQKLSNLLSFNPAKILNKKPNKIAVGEVADLVLVDENETWKVKREDFVSKGKNTPFENFTLTGKVKMTIVDGEIKYPFITK